MKYHEIIHDDNYVIMAQLGISPVCLCTVKLLDLGNMQYDKCLTKI